MVGCHLCLGAKPRTLSWHIYGMFSKEVQVKCLQNGSRFYSSWRVHLLAALQRLLAATQSNGPVATCRQKIIVCTICIFKNTGQPLTHDPLGSMVARRGKDLLPYQIIIVFIPGI